jgi:N-acetylglucosaminyldiphosphoundecaprenol N-acetyl-beta-D-mannosaminyltransferase
MHARIQQQGLPARVSILGIPVDRVSASSAVQIVAQFLAAGGSHHIVTVNPEFVMAAREQQDFRRVLQRADLAIADGIGIVWAAHLLGHRLPERIGGVDLVELLAAWAAREQRRIFLLGAGPGVAEAAAARLISRYPGLAIAGTYAGSPAPEQEAAIIALVRRAQPDILLVAFGAPRQDLWIARTRPLLQAPVAMGVGGAFDFIAGRVPRAPRALQRVGLEWLYRLILQPWRWRRMLALPRFAALVAVSAAGRAVQEYVKHWIA